MHLTTQARFVLATPTQPGLRWWHSDNPNKIFVRRLRRASVSVSVCPAMTVMARLGGLLPRSFVRCVEPAVLLVMGTWQPS